ncbi:hypothetical protein ABZ532_30540 [Streptomyces sp. NPDC019396]|uniref:hypothetical protein n=1 Tax=Streptomyces sp. NPDC019396 TaxID=3154687 RepID=UPI0033FF4A7A
MTNTEVKPEAATDTVTETRLLEATHGAAMPHDEGTRKNKKKGRRRAAKALAYFALIFTGLLLLAEPWLLIPVVALVLAISLWD